MAELNKLTRRLLSEGWKPEDTPPGTKEYFWFYGGWTYTREALAALTFETPCGLLVKGSRFANGDMAFQGISWQPENDNPVVCCPRFELDFCAMRHPMLWNNSYDSSSGTVRQCACHQTDRPYTYEGSLDEAHDRVWAESEVLWKIFQARHKGRVCKQCCCYDRTAKEWHTRYNPIACADGWGRACRYCPVLDKELDTRRGNVFYDVKETRVIKGDWLFPDKEVTTIRKGIKVLDRTVSLTLCEAIVRYAKHHVTSMFMLNHHHELYSDKSLRYELINIRAQRQKNRDIMQDLADTAAGIEVVHQADAEKLRKEQKRARKQARQAQKVRSLEKLVLTGDLDNLTYSQQRGLEKYLSEEQIEELMEQRAIQAKQVQTSLFV